MADEIFTLSGVEQLPKIAEETVDAFMVGGQRRFRRAGGRGEWGRK